MADEVCPLEDCKNLTLFACHGQVFVWNTEEIFEIRSKHRIVGSLIGSLPRNPRQNVYLSLPLVLSREETTLLLEKGIARLVNSEATPCLPNDEEVKAFEKLREDSVMGQAKLFIEERDEKKQMLAEVIEAGRKRKRKGKKRNIGNDEDDGKSFKVMKLEKISPEGNIIKQLEIEDFSEIKKGESVIGISSSTTGSNVCQSEEMEDEDFSEIKKGEPVVGISSSKTGSNVCKNEEMVDEDAKFPAEKISFDIKTRDVESIHVSKVRTCENDFFFLKDLPKVMESVGTSKWENPGVIASIDNYCNEGVLIRRGKETKGDSREQELLYDCKQEKTNEDEVDHDEMTRRQQGTLIHLPTKVSDSITQRYPHQEWTYPQTETEKLRYRIFQDLWEKGFYITSGSKFGGDYLAYPGDPIKFHSFYIVIVVPWERRTGMFDLIAMGRLGATVKKTAVFGSVNANGKVVYVSIRWSGIS